MPFVSTPAPAVEGQRGILTNLRPVRQRGLQLELAERAVLAVSGGADSMVMASMLFETRPDLIAAIATVNHGTGPAATDAVHLVSDWAAERRLPLSVGTVTAARASESAWRAARWAFLRTVAAEHGARVATAHTEDDQAETVLMRLLRGSGVRGLAALRASGPVLRPLLSCSRGDVRATAAEARIPFLDDPSNRDLRHLRNRIRLELLPLLAREAPGFRDWLLSLGEAAAAWRNDVAALVAAHWAPLVQDDQAAVFVQRDRTRLPTVAEAALFWPEVAGRVGVTLDRRGTVRLASFTTKTESGLRMPLSGGAVVTSTREGWTLRRTDASGDIPVPPDRLAPRKP
jgi:tRNA(Ile)-lysidine synthase